MTGPQVQRLADGRLHLNQGPIDLICEAWGTGAAVEAAYRRAVARLETVLPELVAELPALRSDSAVEKPLCKKQGLFLCPLDNIVNVR